jgi:hypothetical protein
VARVSVGIVTSDSRSEDQYGTEVQALLADAVRDELAVDSGIDGLDLPQPVLDRLAQGIISRINYGFRFIWDPSWVKNGFPHQWSEGGRFYARCTACLAVSPAAQSNETVLDWYANHAAAAHGV